jgi:hypothetical protein
MTTSQLLAEYTALLNRHGVDSMEEMQFAHVHAGNLEFADLAKTARWLKRALASVTLSEDATRDPLGKLAIEVEALRAQRDELFAACKAAVPTYEWIIGDHPNLDPDDMLPPELEIIKQAIAKVEGGGA